MRPSWMIALALGIAAATTPSPATAEPTEQEVAEAERLFDLGRIHFRDGQFEKAILKWQEAYALSGRPLIFYNIATAFERLDQPARALEYLRRWREHAPEDERDELEARIAELEAELEAREPETPDDEDEPQKTPADTDETDPDTDETDADTDETDADTDETDADSPAPDPVPDAPDPGGEDAGPAPMAAAGYTLTGIGGAAVVAGIVLDVLALRDRPEVSEACVQSEGRLLCRTDERDAIERSNTFAIAGDVTWVAGAALAATGLALVIVDATGGTDGSEGSGDLSLVPGPLGVNAIGHF